MSDPAELAPERPARRRWIAGAALLVYLALAAVALRVPREGFTTRIASDRGDPIFVLYTMQWGAHQIGLGMPSFWHAPIFYPARWATTYSDHVLLLAAFVYLGGLVGAGPVATYNVLVVLSFALTAWTCFLVFRRSGLGNAAALFGGCLFGFSPYRFQQLPHLQVLWMVCLAPTLWTFDRLLAAPSRRRAAIFLGFYAAHVLAGNYLAYMIHLPLAVLLLNRLRSAPTRAAWRRHRLLLGGTALVCGAFVAAVFVPYLIAARELGLHRSAIEMLDWGASLASYVDPGGVWYSRFVPRGLHRSENGLFAGFVATALALWGLAVGAARLRPPTPGEPLAGSRRFALAACLAVGLGGIVLGEAFIWRFVDGTSTARRFLPAALIALGAVGWLVLCRRWRPGARWNWDLLPDWDRGLLAAGGACLVASLGYVYIAGAAFVPGMSSMRVPARFYPFVSLAIAFVAARLLDRWWRSRRLGAQRGWTALILAGLLAFTVVDLFPVRTRWPWLPATPPIYARIAADPAVGAVLELPFFQLSSNNNIYLQFQPAHWKPIVNGYSGYLPPGHTELRDLCTPVPGPAALAELRRLGVTHLVLHLDLVRRWQRREFRDWLETAGLPVVAREGQVLLLSTTPRRS
jgi:hypothetical protein